MYKHRYFATLNPKAGNLLTLFDKKEHGKRRRLLGPSFNEDRVRNFQSNMARHTRLFLDLLGTSAHTTASDDDWLPAQNMTKWCDYLIFDLLIEFLLGFQCNMLTSTEWRSIIDDMEAASVRNAVRICTPALMIWRMDKLLFPDSVRGTRKFWNWVKHVMDVRAKRDLTDDAYSCLLRTGLPEETIRSELGLLITAGESIVTGV